MSVRPGFVERMREAMDQAYRWSDWLWLTGLAVAGLVGLTMLLDPRPRAFGVGLLLITIAGVAYIVRRARRRRTFATHPLGAAFRRYGDPDAVARDIDADFAGESSDGGPLYVGKQWLCYVRGKRAAVRRVDELIWAYTERIVHRMNLIPYRVTYQLLIWDRSGRGLALRVRKREAGPSLQRLGTTAPWILLGYTEAIKESWNSDRGDLIAYVDGRRQGPSG